MATITLKNRAQINLTDGSLERIIELADLPTGTILLILHDHGIGNREGGTIPKSLIKYNTHMAIFSLYPVDCWDCWIMLSREVCVEREENPAYFAYLIGHELGHARTCLTDLELHILTCLIDMFIRDASDQRITAWHQTPHERRYDQFGIYIAEQLYTREQLNAEIEELLGDSSRDDHNRLEYMLSLQPSNSLNNLRHETINLVRPYKERFLGLCAEHIVETNSHSIATEIPNLGDLIE